MTVLEDIAIRAGVGHLATLRHNLVSSIEMFSVVLNSKLYLIGKISIIIWPVGLVQPLQLLHSYPVQGLIAGEVVESEPARLIIEPSANIVILSLVNTKSRNSWRVQTRWLGLIRRTVLYTQTPPLDSPIRLQL